MTALLKLSEATDFSTSNQKGPKTPPPAQVLSPPSPFFLGNNEANPCALCAENFSHLPQLCQTSYLKPVKTQ